MKVFVRDKFFNNISNLYEDIPETKEIIIPYSQEQSESKNIFLGNKNKLNLSFLAKDLDILIATIFNSVESVKNVVDYNPAIMLLLLCSRL